jgi:DNA uptake protein ComE-like DNA-binding protein
VKLKDSTKGRGNPPGKHSRDDAFHLYSILLVVMLSLLAWGVESASARESTSSSKDLLVVLNAISKEQLAKSDSPVSIAQASNRIVSLTPKVILSKNYKYTFEKAYKKSLTPSPGSINLNYIDSVALESLPVFGPVLSSRTTKFRDALGGFVEVRQLLDVYGFSTEYFDKVKSWFYIDQMDIKPLCVNEATWKQMRNHPYIGAEGATIIERYRRHNILENIMQLKSLPNMSDSTWTRWEPYVNICSLE